MKLVLCNGYPSPYDIGDNRTGDFQQDAPGNDLTIDDVINLELKHTLTVTLKDEATAHAVQQLTGWPWWTKSTNTLEATLNSDEGYAHPAIVVRRSLFNDSPDHQRYPQTAYCGFLLVE